MLRELVTSKIMIGDEEIDIEGRIYYSVDINYGADADGHRGYRRTSVEDIKDVTAYDMLGEEVELSANDRERAIEKLTNKFLQG